MSQSCTWDWRDVPEAALPGTHPLCIANRAAIRLFPPPWHMAMRNALPLRQNTLVENETSLQVAEISKTWFLFELVYSLKPAAPECELQDGYRECCSSWPGQSVSALPSEGHTVSLSRCHPAPSRLLLTESQQCVCKYRHEEMSLEH